MEAELRKENEELKRQLAHTEADRDRYLCRCQELEQRLAEVEPPDQMITTEAQTVEATSSESDLPTGFRVLKKSNNKRKEIAPGESVAPKRSKVCFQRFALFKSFVFSHKVMRQQKRFKNVSRIWMNLNRII